MVKPAPNKPRPRPRYYLGCCFNGPGGTVAEVAISTKPVVQALPEMMYPACPICSNGHTIYCAEVSFDQFMYGAAASAKEEAIDDDAGELEATEQMARDYWLPRDVHHTFKEIQEHGDDLLTSQIADQRKFITNLQLIAEELDLDWEDLINTVASEEARAAMTEFLKEGLDG